VWAYKEWQAGISLPCSWSSQLSFEFLIKPGASCSFLVDIIYKVEEIPQFLVCERFFSATMGVEFCQILFLHVLTQQCDFSSLVDVMGFDDWFSNMEPVVHTWSNSHSIMLNNSYASLDSIYYFFIDDFCIHAHEKYWSIISFSCNIFCLVLFMGDQCWLSWVSLNGSFTSVFWGSRKLIEFLLSKFLDLVLLVLEGDWLLTQFL
jgi:hypothetical protein